MQNVSHKIPSVGNFAESVKGQSGKVIFRRVQESIGTAKATEDEAEVHASKENLKILKAQSDRIKKLCTEYQKAGEDYGYKGSRFGDYLTELSAVEHPDFGELLQKVGDAQKAVDQLIFNLMTETNTHLVQPIRNFADVDLKVVADIKRKQETSRVQYDIDLQRLQSYEGKPPEKYGQKIEEATTIFTNSQQNYKNDGELLSAKVREAHLLYQIQMKKALVSYCKAQIELYTSGVAVWSQLTDYVAKVERDLEKEPVISFQNPYDQTQHQAGAPPSANPSHENIFEQENYNKDNNSVQFVVPPRPVPIPSHIINQPPLPSRASKPYGAPPLQEMGVESAFLNQELGNPPQMAAPFPHLGHPPQQPPPQLAQQNQQPEQAPISTGPFQSVNYELGNDAWEKEVRRYTVPPSDQQQVSNESPTQPPPSYEAITDSPVDVPTPPYYLSTNGPPPSEAQRVKSVAPYENLSVPLD